MQIHVFRESKLINKNDVFIASKDSVEGHSRATLKSVGSVDDTFALLQGMLKLADHTFAASLIDENCDTGIGIELDKIKDKLKELVESIKDQRIENHQCLECAGPMQMVSRDGMDVEYHCPKCEVF